MNISFHRASSKVLWIAAACLVIGVVAGMSLFIFETLNSTTAPKNAKASDPLDFSLGPTQGLLQRSKFGNNVRAHTTDRQLLHLSSDGPEMLLPLKGRNVRRLDLRFADVSELEQSANGFALLSEEPLVVINLAFTNLTDRGLEEISRIKSLRLLNLQACHHISDAGARFLSMLPLAELIVDSTDLTDDGFREFAKLRSLGRIDLDGTNLTDRGLLALAPLTGLRHLSLSKTRITDSGISIVKNMPQLRYLSVSNTAITTAGLAEVLKDKSIFYLNLSALRLTDDDLKPLSRLKVTNLILSENHSITPKGIGHILPVKELEYLELMGCNKISRQYVTWLDRHSPKRRVASTEDDYSTYRSKLDQLKSSEFSASTGAGQMDGQMGNQLLPFR